MPRGDIQIDINTNDLRIDRSKSNTYLSTSWRYDDISDVVILSINVPQNFADGNNSSLNWRQLLAPIRSIESIDNSHDSLPVHLEFTYNDSNGLKNIISNLQLAYDSEDSFIEYLTVSRLNSLVSASEANEDFVFNYRKDADTDHEYFILNILVLGDFVVEDNINQNEYILLNANEGGFLQNPTFGVGAANYINSPTSDDQFLQIIVDKLAQDSLRVLGIQKVNEVIELQSKDFNRE